MIEQHNSLTEKFLKKGFWLYLFTFILAPVGYIIKIIISWELTVSEVWILYGIISLITLISSFNDFWMTESLKHFIPKFIVENRYDKIKSILSYALIIQMLTWISIWLFFVYWSDFIANNYFKNPEATNVLKIFSLYFIWINLFQIVSTFFLTIQNTFYNKIIDFCRMMLILSSVLYVYFLNLWNIINYSYTWIIWLYWWVIIAIIIFYKKYYNIHLKESKIIWKLQLFKKTFKYALWILLWAQASTILGQMDMQMIIYLLWTTEAWYYTNYLSIIGIPFMLIWPIFALLFPIFSEMHSKWEEKKINIVKWVFQKNFLVIWIAFNILFFVFSEVIAFVLFWEKFIESWVILKYSILFLTFNFLLQINFNIMAWIWKVKERVKIISVALIFNFILNLILIKNIWVYGAALATWCWWVLIWVLSEIRLWNKYYVKFNIKFLLKNIITLWSLWAICYFYIIKLFYWLGRLDSFYIMFIVWLTWFWLFWLINYKEFKGFILEVKKLRS